MQHCFCKVLQYRDTTKWTRADCRFNDINVGGVAVDASEYRAPVRVANSKIRSDPCGENFKCQVRWLHFPMWQVYRKVSLYFS